MNDMPSPAQPTAPSLCLAMIVKDEATHLSEWLHLARLFLDELVVVDTGSSDDTVALVEAAGGRVLHQQWQHDFALHRNHGLDHVQSQWILILDADERLDEESWKAIRRLISRPDPILAYAFDVKNYHSASDPTAFDIMPSYRLFRNGHHIRYAGAVHNQLAESIKAASAQSGLSVAPAHLTIDHFGYSLPADAMQRKQERIYQMVKNTLAKQGDDPYYLFHLLTICLASGRYDEAYFALHKLDYEALRPELRVRALCKAAQVTLQHDLLEEARAFVRKALLLAPNAPFVHYLYSNILYQSEKFSQGLRVAYRALENAQRNAPTEPGIHIGIEDLLCNVALGYLLRGEYRLARSHFDAALVRNPQHQEADRWLAHMQSLEQVKQETAQSELAL